MSNNYYGNSWNNTAEAGSRSVSLPTVNAFLQQVLSYMSIGLAITGVIAYFVGQSMLGDYLVFEETGILPDGLFATVFTTPLRWVVMLAPFAFVLILSFGINRLSFGTAAILLIAFSATMGLSLSFIFIMYTGASIALTFFTTAGMFAAMALIGLTTKVDLTKYSSYFMMALIGLIIVGVVNMFVGSTTLGYIYGAAGVIIFSALIAYDIQRLTQTSGLMDGNSEAAKKAGLMGALSLYLNFINLFLFLLRFLGQSRS